MTLNTRSAEPCIMVIFGATGDLTKRKLFPALYNLAKEGHMPENFAVVGVGRQEMSSEEFRREMADNLREFAGANGDAQSVKWFCGRTYYTGGDFDDDERLFGDIKQVLDEVAGKLDIPPNYLFYMAVPPDLFASVAKKAVKHGLGNETDGWRRFVFEKPFGRDLESARELNSELLDILDEKQIYRIDHYLGKETVQNLLVFRFGNSVFEPIWNRNFVDHVQITVAETLGVEGREDTTNRRAHSGI
jgi:glucose-6-phosphate 1-dehydrogenase